MAIAYFQQYPDVAASYAQNTYGLTPEAFAKFHYENYGVNEKRVSPEVAEVAAAGAAGSGTTVAPTLTPVAAAYFQQNPDVAQAYQENTYGLTPDQFASTHYQLYGQEEQRVAPTESIITQPSTPTTISNVIDTIGSNTPNTTNTATTTTALPAYFAQNPDVAAAYKVNTFGLTPEQYAAEHYKLYGGTEQRANPAAVTAIASGNLSTLPQYFRDNPDVAASYLTNTYGLTPEQFAAKHFELYGKKEQRVAPPVTPTTGTTITPAGTPIGTPIAPPTVQVGQFRELFPSFAESKRLAGEMVSKRPSMQSIISMIQNPVSSGIPTYFMQNPDVAAAYAQNNYGMTPEQFAATHYQKFGQTEQRSAPVTTALPAYLTQNPDVAVSYLTNSYGLTPEQFAATHYQKFGQAEQRAAPAAAPSLNNVLSMIGK